MIARLSIAALAILVTTGVAAPAEAQRRQRVVEVFGDDKCSPSSNDEIVVCSRRPESDRYRIPTELREAATADATTREAQVDEMVALGRTGTGSCSPVGPGGFTGCFEQIARTNRDEKKAVRRRKLEEPQ